MTAIINVLANPKRMIEHAKDGDICILSINPNETEIGLVAKSLQGLLDKGEDRPRLVFITFECDSDPREVWDIPEVKAWCKRFIDSNACVPTLKALADDVVWTGIPNHLATVMLGGIGINKFLLLAGLGSQQWHDQGFFTVQLTPEGRAIASSLRERNKAEA